jgi:hypothetical protein
MRRYPKSVKRRLEEQSVIRRILARPAKNPGHLLNAGLSFIGLVTCAVIGGELISDIRGEEECFPQVPKVVKYPALVVFCIFTAMEANKVRDRLTRARGFN